MVKFHRSPPRFIKISSCLTIVATLAVVLKLAVVINSRSAEAKIDKEALDR